jgi:hypothetical protein
MLTTFLPSTKRLASSYIIRLDRARFLAGAGPPKREGGDEPLVDVGLPIVDADAR